jgi:hypothetical protein
MPDPILPFLQGFNPGRLPAKSNTRYGYTVEDSITAGWDDWMKKNPNVTGMAVGGPSKLNGDERPDRAIVVNPYSEHMVDPVKREALIKLEAARHLMDEQEYRPDFPITPSMQAWRKANFVVGKDPYATDDQAFRETMISRHLVGDLPDHVVSPEIQKETRYWNMLLRKRDQRASPMDVLDKNKGRVGILPQEILQQ